MPVPLAFKARLSRQLSSKFDIMDPKSSLVLTQIIFRHGHRSPDQAINYPGDPYENEQYLPYGKGELTLQGRKQSYTFGQHLRQRYGHFLGADYYSGLLDARASEVSRARTTLQLVLAGLFPPGPSTQIDDELNWQPIPFTYAPLKQDALIARAIMQMYNHEDHPEFGSSKNSQEVIRCMEEKLKWPVRGQGQCLLVYDTIRTQLEYGLEMPAWCTEIFPEKLQRENDAFLQHNFSRKRFLVDGHGAMMKHICDVMTGKIKEMTDDSGKLKTTPKMHLYSGHDVNLAGLLSILGSFEHREWPKYLSNLVFELHHLEDDFYVKILYQEGTNAVLSKDLDLKTIEMIKLPKSKEDLYKISEFVEYVQEYFPQQA